MKLSLSTWLFFSMLCCQALSNMASLKSSTSKHEDFNLPKDSVRLQEQIHGLNATIGGEGDHRRELYKGKHEIFWSIKGRKGKGAYGGANIVHRPRPTQVNAASLSPQPSTFVSTSMMCVSLALLLMFPRKLK